MKIALMSLAHLHAEDYLPLLRALPGVELLGIADDDPTRGQQFATQHEARLFPSYEALLDARPDGVVICSENSRHRPLVELAASAGAHVLCEKPLATTVADARAMVEACERAGVTLMTAFPMRFNAPLQAVKAQLEAGELGRPLCANGTNQGEMPNHVRPWFIDPELAGGGAVTDHTVHLADVLRWYLGQEVEEVYAQTNRILYADEAKVETGGLLMLRFASGVFATIDCSWSKPRGYPTWGGLTLELVTERGAVQIDAFRQNLQVYSGGRGASWAYWGSDANAAMIANFVESVGAGAPPAVTGRDGLRAVEVVHAAYESARTGRPVRVERG
jgi:predicted dehydrogenase